MAIPEPSWRLQAACRGMDVNVFYENGECEAAKAVCARCPVRAQCGRFAWDKKEEYGVWGGQTKRDRVRAQRNSLRRKSRSKAVR